MAYIGKPPNTTGKDAGPSLKLDDISSGFNGNTKVFDLTVAGTSVDPHVNNTQIYLSGVHQLPGTAYTLSGSQIVFTAAPSSSLSFHGAMIGDATLFTPNQDTIEPAAFTDNARTTISGSFSQTHLSSKISGIISGAAQLPSGVVSASVLSSPAQGTIRLATNGVNTDVDSGLQAGDSPTFAAGTITGDLSVGGTLTAQEIHTEFTSASIMFSSGSTKFGDTIDDTHEVTGSMTMSGSVTVNDGNLTVTDDLSVDGTTNLDNTDIDGTLTVDGGNIVFNEASANQDFRVESNGQTHMLFVDGDDKIGIAEDTPTALLHITRAAGSYTAANLAESAGAGVFRVQPDGTNQTSLHASSVTNFRVALQVSGSSSGDNDIVLQPFAGRVGIGTRSPASTLDVSSAETSNTANFNSTSGTTNITFKENGTLTGQIEFHSGSNQISQIVTRKTGGTLALGSNNVQTLFITDNDFVGIGTNNPGNPLHIHSDTYPQLNIDGTDNSGNIGFVLSGSGGRGGMRWNGSNNDVEILREGGGVEISLLDGGGTQFAGNLKIDRTADGGNSVLTIQNSAGAGSTDETAQLVFNHTSNSTLGAKITCPRADNYNASGNQSAKLLFTVNSEGSSKTALEIDQFGTHIYDQNLNKGVFYVDTESTDQDVFFMDTELTSGKAFHVDVDAITTGMIMDLNSNHNDSTTRTLVSIINDSSGATGATPFFVRQDANNRTVAFESARGDLSNDILRMNALGRSSTNNFSFLVTFTDGDDDFQHAMKGDGSLVADGAYDSSGADYAEYFESKDGSAISVGTTVRLDGDKIVSCSVGDTPLGVIRPKNSSATIGNTATFRWAEKYLKDDYGGFQMEQHTITTWDVSGSEDATGGIVTIQHHTDKIPSDVTVPSDAEIISTEEDGSPLMRRKLNPKYTSSLTYVSREDRDEWNIVGLLGQIPITKGQPTGSQWVKMRDISDTVELWFVK